MWSSWPPASRRMPRRRPTLSLVRRVALVNFVSQMQLGTELVRDCDCRATGRWSSSRRWPSNAPSRQLRLRRDQGRSGCVGQRLGGRSDRRTDPDPRRAPRHGAHAHEHQAQRSAVHLRPRRRRGSGGEEPSHGPDHRVGPPQLRLLMSGLRHAPRPVFRKASKMR